MRGGVGVMIVRVIAVWSSLVWTIACATKLRPADKSHESWNERKSPEGTLFPSIRLPPLLSLDVQREHC